MPNCPPKKPSLSGLVVGVMTVLRKDFQENGRGGWRLRCVCEKEIVRPRTVITGKKKIYSCGCRKGDLKRRDLTGMVFGRLTVLHFDYESKLPTPWKCKCSCGNEKSFSASSLERGAVKSCGCLSTDNKTKHGHYGTPTYRSWSAMKERCLNPKHMAHHIYKNIKICDRWLGDKGFSNFLEDMGERPLGKTLDRWPDMNGGYNKQNCRWASLKEQSNNRNDTRIFTLNGESKCISDWSKHFGIPHSSLRLCLKRLGTIEAAIQYYFQRVSSTQSNTPR